MEGSEWIGASIVKVALGGRSAVIIDDDDAARYRAADRLRSSKIADRGAFDLPLGIRKRVLVEVRRQVGGLGTPRAMVGGHFVVDEGAQTFFEVLVQDDLDKSTAHEVASHLSTRPLVSGCPREFASAVLSGLSGGAQSTDLPPGRLVIDRAAFDVRETNADAFIFAAALLRRFLVAMFHGDNLEIEVTNMLRRWASV